MLTFARLLSAPTTSAEATAPHQIRIAYQVRALLMPLKRKGTKVTMPKPKKRKATVEIIRGGDPTGPTDEEYEKLKSYQSFASEYFPFRGVVLDYS